MLLGNPVSQKQEKTKHKKVTGKHLFFRCFLFVQLFYLQGKEEKQGIIISHVAGIEMSSFKMFSYKTFWPLLIDIILKYVMVLTLCLNFYI